MGRRENKVEKYLQTEMVRIGGLSRKWVSPAHAYVPDQIIFYKARVFFVEVKTVDGIATSGQIREHQRLRDQGAGVYSVYGKMQVDQFINMLIML